MSDSWAAVAALATSISAVVVAAQTYYTRRAAQETAAAAAATRLSAEGTAATLIEAAKARLDARAPRVRVLLDPPSSTSYEPSVAGGTPQLVPANSVFRTPRDRDHELGLSVEGVVLNTGDDVVLVHLHAPLVVVREQDGASTLAVPSSTQVRMRPGATVWFRLFEARPLDQWIANWRASYEVSNPGSPPSVIIAEIICSDAYDDGVVDRWRIELTGRPVEPVPGEDGSWKVRGTPGMPPTDPPNGDLSHQRVYYRSKRANQVLG